MRYWLARFMCRVGNVEVERVLGARGSRLVLRREVVLSTLSQL
jgi:hypothetical protein